MFTAKLSSLELRQKRYIFDPYNATSIGLSLLINIIHWALLYFKLGRSAGTIILHFNFIYGADFVDKAKYIYLVPGIALILLAADLILANYFYKKEKLAAYFLNFSSLVIQIIFLTASIAIILVNE
ncbi:MAG: hypothetical protein KW788_02880 [Candidatus Doudnabacteria bacterium]|nr:hypothetical protein [Candidatus Doudnabacteria bacterium]